MAAYYNENDPFAAAWLRELIQAGLIAQGEVDERSIVDVKPADLAGFTQCHFFAGIGGWSYALRLAGWPDDRPVWTGSCPCQPFSAAGKGAGFDDERHLWPAWFHLISQCTPEIIFGEQVDAAIRHGWLDLIQTDLEANGYAFAAVGLPAASVGAPHIRQRLWFVAESNRITSGQGCALNGRRDTRSDAESRAGLGSGKLLGKLADTGSCKRGQRIPAAEHPKIPVAICSDLGNSEQPRFQEQRSDAAVPCETLGAIEGQAVVRASAPAFWSACDWLPCIDGKARPVEPRTFPLAHGVSARVGRLRGYGNAIVPQVGAEVIAAYLDAEVCR